jgi:hypothetical protein
MAGRMAMSITAKHNRETGQTVVLRWEYRPGSMLYVVDEFR